MPHKGSGGYKKEHVGMYFDGAEANEAILGNINWRGGLAMAKTLAGSYDPKETEDFAP